MPRRNSIFMKFLAIMLAATLIISIVITIATSRISEQLLLKQITQNASVNMELVRDELLKYNEQIVNTMIRINNSDAFKQYLTQPTKSTLDQLNIIMNLGRYIDTYKEYLSPDQTHFIVAGISENKDRNFSSNALKWDRVPSNIIDDYMVKDGLVQQKILYHGSQNLFADSVPYERYIFATKPLMDTFQRKMYGYTIVIMNEQTIYDIYNPYLSDGAEISLVTSTGYVMSSSVRNNTNVERPELLEYAQLGANPTQYGIMTENDMTYISFYIPEFDAYLLQEIDGNIAFAPLHKIAYRIAEVVIIVFLLIIISVYFITRKITKPLYELVDTMQNAKVDSLHSHPIQEGVSYEIKVVTKTYNHLVKEIDRYTNRLIVEQNERRKADLSALQMQINPHFLYNTLTSIKYLAKMNRIDDVDRTITSLSAMLQNTIGSTEDTVTVDQEIENLKHYVYINKIRYGDQVDVLFDIRNDCKELFIPKLIIQPFVENAFFHAFPGMRKGTIHIFIRQQGDRLLIEVLDDGVGAQEKKERVKKRSVSGIGIDNVHHRIGLLYGSKYGVELESASGYGTAVKISLPIVQNINVEQ
ncbi:sensor histidine kinase [Paenibacillus endoradicis]|uniref:sensor histidine kinase n=1 Tax=Paenibacillus endoradicis TaxID=2972487 RepID=UPI002158A9D6|nr:sensor histidine kinase [Paenibacillus endoradicis]